MSTSSIGNSTAATFASWINWQAGYLLPHGTSSNKSSFWSILTQRRDFVTPDDIQYVSEPVLNHRIILTPETEMEGITAEDVIAEIFYIVSNALASQSIYGLSNFYLNLANNLQNLFQILYISYLILFH